MVAGSKCLLPPHTEGSAAALGANEVAPKGFHSPDVDLSSVLPVVAASPCVLAFAPTEMVYLAKLKPTMPAALVSPHSLSQRSFFFF